VERTLKSVRAPAEVLSKKMFFWTFDNLRISFYPSYGLYKKLKLM
jgi:hypothetical protein